jgi:hypothetical protein
MHLQAEVNCYHCGYVSGTWRWPATSSGRWGMYAERGQDGQRVSRLRDVRCSQCRGPVFLDEIYPVRPWTPATCARPRRGRPVKQAPLQAS